MRIKPLFNASYFKKTGITKLLIVLLAYISRILSIIEILLFKKKYDLILLEYELLPYFPAIFEYLLAQRGIRYIVDYDDAIFHKYDMSSNFIVKLFLKNKIAKVATYAHRVIACNAYLENYLKQYSSQIVRLPTVVLLDKYKEKLKSFTKREDKFIFGWIGSRTTSIYILEILPAIKNFVDKYPDTTFNLVGFDKNLLSKEQVEEYHLNVIEWKEESEVDEILKFDVGIMPLRDNPWSHGKCGFKLIQYMSCKKPVIASPVGINCNIVNENGCLVESLDEWYEAFEKIYLKREERISMGLKGFEIIEKQFNHHINCEKYINLLEEMKRGY